MNRMRILTKRNYKENNKIEILKLKKIINELSKKTLNLRSKLIKLLLEDKETFIGRHLCDLLEVPVMIA